MKTAPGQIERRNGSHPAGAEDWAYQHHILPRVSRTFALTIPELPGGLREVVANGYLLCRIADTIEDEPALDPETKHALHRRFAEVVAGVADPGPFAREVAPRLSNRVGADELDLVRRTPQIVRITHGFSGRQRAALERCVGIMCDGMPHFQKRQARRGLADVRELHRYCYYVAGVVGEMLTDLFIDHAPDIAARAEELRGRTQLDVLVTMRYKRNSSRMM